MNFHQPLNIGIITLAIQSPKDEFFLPWQNELIRRLSESCRVRVFPLFHPNQSEAYWWEGAKVFPQKSVKFQKLNSNQQIRKQLKCLEKEYRKQRFDLLHAIWATEPAEIGRRFSQQYKTPFVVTITGGELTALPSIGYGGQLKRRSRRTIQKNLEAAHQIFVLSTMTQKQCHQLFPQMDSKVQILPWGVDPQIYPATTSSQKEKSDTLKMIIVGSLLKVKDHETLFYGVQKAKRQGVSLSLTVVGDGSQRERLQKLSKVLGLEQEVVFCGEIPHRAILSLYQQADVVVSTSQYESQGMSILEGMSCGLAVMGTPVGVLADVVNEGQNGFCFPVGDIQACAQSIITLASDPNLLRTMGEKAKQDCHRLYNSKERTLAIIKEYEKVILKFGFIISSSNIAPHLPYIPSKQEMDSVPPILKRSWENKKTPQRVLAIRLQAMGDMLITLPYLAGLKKSHPNLQLDFLTREEWVDIPENLDLFEKVYCLKGGRNYKKQWLYSLLLLPQLFLKRYEIVIDLQGNGISRLIRNILFPQGWCEFDRFSPLAAGHRVYRTIQTLGLSYETAFVKPKLRVPKKGEELLVKNGYDINNLLVVLNPASFFSSRKWPLKHFVHFAELWRKKHSQTQFLFLGDNRYNQEEQYLKEQLGTSLISLNGQTSPSEALSILQMADLIISEDSGLMHMAWISEIPTIVLLGATRSDWCMPLGPHSLCLNSSDLLCGECMSDTCRLGDPLCLNRYTPNAVFHFADSLWQNYSCLESTDSSPIN